MKSYLLDTNVLIRFLVADHPDHYKRATEWFMQGQQGKKEIIISSSMVAEVAFVLEKVYLLKRTRISELLQVFLSQKWLHVPERVVLQQLWTYYIKGFHFVDSYLLTKAQLEGISVLSFDKKLLKSLE